MTALLPYLQLARLHRPVGTGLLLLPAWWGLSLASQGVPPFGLILLFFMGALIMRSAGCVYNDMVDRRVDAHVDRTRDRPLASGELTPLQGGIFFLLLLSGGALILFALPPRVIGFGFGVLGLILLYPWMKRLTYWPQLFLGLTFNSGLLLAWLTLKPSLTAVPVLFYLGGIFWTLGYDTIYAFQDRKDDLLIGVKSAAIVTQNNPKFALSVMYFTALTSWIFGGILAELGVIFFISLALVSVHMTWQINTLDIHNPDNCLKRFKSNTLLGFFLLLGIVFSEIIT